MREDEEIQIVLYLNPGEFSITLIPLVSCYNPRELLRFYILRLDDEDENLGAAEDEDEGGRKDCFTCTLENSGSY